MRSVLAIFHVLAYFINTKYLYHILMQRDKARVINVPTLNSRLLISLITVYIIILGQRNENTYLRTDGGTKRRKTYTPRNPTYEHMYVGGHNNFFLLRYSLTYGRVGGYGYISRGSHIC